MSAGVAAQYCHLGVISSTRRRTVINEETFDWNAVQLGILLFCNMRERKITRGLRKMVKFLSF
jgi:hypothetical protein